MHHLISGDLLELTMLQMVGLTCVVGGIQVIWAILMGSTSVSCRNGIQAERDLT
jgi:hypothetical protein